MKIRDIFKSKVAERPLESRVGWFGKLPDYADYYKSSDGADWAYELQRWIQGGVVHYKEHLDKARDQCEGTSNATNRNRMLDTQWIIRLPESKMCVLASMQDFGGDSRGRPFPMCFFVAIPSERWRGPTSGLFSAAAQQLAELTRLHDEVVAYLNAPGSFEQHFANRHLGLEGLDENSESMAWTSAARRIAMSDWFTGAIEESDANELPDWLAAANQWGCNIASHEADGFQPTLRLPLAAGQPMEAQVAGWLQWLESWMSLSGREVSLVINGNLGCAPGSLTVIVRPPLSSDFLLATDFAGVLDYTDDVAGFAAEQIALALESSGPAGIVAPPTWADFASREAPTS